MLGAGIGSTYELPPLFADVADVFEADVNRSVSSDDLNVYQELIEKLLSEGFTVTVEGESYIFPAQRKDIVLEKKNSEIVLSFSSAFMTYMLDTLYKETFEPWENIYLLDADESKASKGVLEGKIINGKELLRNLTEEMMLAAVNRGETQSLGLVRIVEGSIINKTGKNLGPLDLLAQGKSTFWGSSPEREFNIRKALNERFNGILIPPGAEFSYLEFLGPIEWGGWKQAYTIFKGTQLEPAPAGGVCQVSTTVYRAALDAALEITEQRNHSLYVIYYNDYGDGLDATVFPGEQDLKFINNTPNYLLMVAQEEGYYEAVIRFYGEDDGRGTTLIGPYTTSNQTDESTEGVGQLGIGEMAWKYLIKKANGTEEVRWLHSTYMSKVKQYKEEAKEL